MPVEIALWNVSDGAVSQIDFSTITSEKRLENIIFEDVSILSDSYMIIGKQIRTPFGTLIDILAIDGDGKLTIIELKRSKTPREVVAQALDYASWVQELSYKDIISLFNEKNGKEFEPAFEEFFGVTTPERINQEHDIVIVCTELDNATERIINYLSDNYGVPINAVFFRFFTDNKTDYIARSWLIDPTETGSKPSKTIEKWNGKDFVVNIDVDSNGISSWEDAVKYGFVSAGGGMWYSRTLNQLFPGARVFAMMPKKGYIGVGIVLERSKPIKEFVVDVGDSKMISILDVDIKASGLKNHPDDLVKCEYFVRVEWIKTLQEENAYWEKGLRANQNSAFKLRSKYTLDKLLNYFNIEE